MVSHGNRFLDISGEKYGRLTVLSFYGRDSQKRSIWNCRCDCGEEKAVRSNFLRRGITRSCGCLAKETSAVSGKIGRAKISGPRSHLWNSKLSAKERAEKRRFSPFVRDWRLAVWGRDDYTCKACGCRGGSLNAHHLDSWASSPEKRFEVSNGVTLCRRCHKAFHAAMGGERVPCSAKDFESYMDKLLEVSA